MNIELINFLKRAVQCEEEQLKVHGKPDYVGWSLDDVGLLYHQIIKYINDGLVKRRARNWYVLTDRELAKKLIQEIENSATIKEVDIEKLNPPLFYVIEGHEDEKQLILRALKSDKPVHFLLVGPPATAKSLFLSEIERLGGAMYITGGSSSKAGISEILSSYPDLRFLLIDEIDKANTHDLDCLLSVCETGRVIINKFGRHVDHQTNVKVFAACNDSSKLPKELLDRFLVLKIKDYSEEETKSVIIKMLTTEGYSKDFIEKLIEKCFANGITRVRTIRGLARLCGNDVSNLDLVEKYSKFYL